MGMNWNVVTYKHHLKYGKYGIKYHLKYGKYGIKYH